MNRTTLQISLILLLAACPRALAQDADTPDLADTLSGGDVLAAQSAMLAESPEGAEKFVPPAADLRSFSSATIVLRPEATITDSIIHIKNICRWTERDAAMFAPLAELAVTHVPANRTDVKVTLDQVRQTLSGAGINPALVSFDGAMTCSVHRDPGPAIEQMSLDEWIDAHRAAADRAVTAAATQSPVAPPMPAPLAHAPANDQPLRQLRSILATDLCGRLHLDPDKLELTFNSVDDKVLNLAEPFFQFQIIPRRVRTLGDVEWEVVVASGTQRQKATIDAVARVWQTEAIIIRPIAYQQPITAQDVDEKKILIDALSSQTFLAKSQAVGQSAARELRPGTILTPDMIDPLVLVKPGQLITVNIARGNIRLTAVAKALQPGSLGQTIRARSDVDPTRLFEVTLTGPQEGTVVSTPDDAAPIAAAH